MFFRPQSLFASSRRPVRYLFTTAGWPKRNPLPVNSLALLSFPLRHPSAPQRYTKSVFGGLKERYLLANSLERAKKALRHPTYDVPADCLTDCLKVWEKFISSVDTRNAIQLNELTMPALCNEFTQSWNALDAESLQISVKLSSASGALKAELRKVNITYGPYPVPEGYGQQHWSSSMTLVVPNDEVDFINHRTQLETYQKAMEAGQYIRLLMKISCDLLLVVKKDNKVIASDKRQTVDVEFISPHFRADEEIMEFVPSPGEESQSNGHSNIVKGKWKLKWDWRVSDVDYLLASRRPERLPPRIKLRERDTS